MPMNSYHEPVFKPERFRNTLEWATRAIVTMQHRGIKVDMLVGSGHSGLLLLGALSAIVDIPPVAVRRDANERAHQKEALTGEIVPGGGYVFIDDLISTGSTLLRCVKAMESYSSSVKLVGVILYRHTDLSKVRRLEGLHRCCGLDKYNDVPVVCTYL